MSSIHPQKIQRKISNYEANRGCPSSQNVQSGLLGHLEIKIVKHSKFYFVVEFEIKLTF